MCSPYPLQHCLFYLFSVLCTLSSETRVHSLQCWEVCQWVSGFPAVQISWLIPILLFSTSLTRSSARFLILSSAPASFYFVFLLSSSLIQSLGTIAVRSQNWSFHSFRYDPHHVTLLVCSCMDRYTQRLLL
jgi:hypothetical protein